MSDDQDGDDGGAEREWRFAVDEVGEDSVAGSMAPAAEIEPEEIDRENALFVVLGVALGLALIVLLVP